MNVCGSLAWQVLGVQAWWRLWMPVDCQFDRPQGHDPVEQTSYRPVQAWGAQPHGNHECLWITSLAGLRGLVQWRLCRSGGWEFGGSWLWCYWGVNPRIGDPTTCRAVATWAYEVGLGCHAGCCLSKSWCREAFHKLVLYLSQACLSKLPGSQSSRGLWLCPSRHFGTTLSFEWVSHITWQRNLKWSGISNLSTDLHKGRYKFFKLNIIFKYIPCFSKIYWH
jgi:hypothetical protein